LRRHARPFTIVDAGAPTMARRWIQIRASPAEGRRMDDRSLAALWLALVVALLPAAARAADAERDDPTDQEIARRLSFIETRLDSHRRHAEIWHWSWAVINGGAAVGLGIAAGLADDTPDRVNFATQSALAGFGALDVILLRPIPGRMGADPIRALPQSTHAERLEALREAEERLRRSARRDRFRMDWRVHVANVAVNLAAGGIVWAAGDGEAGLITAASGMAGGLLYLLTEPPGRNADLVEYERFAGQPPSRPTGGWSLVPRGTGIALRFDF
jgi:hypothetical protein